MKPVLASTELEWDFIAFRKKVLKRKRIPAPFFRQLARFGCLSTGVVYAIVGAVALMSLLRVRHGGADEASILRLLEDVPLGKMVIAIIMLGMMAYIIWRFYEAFNDPYVYGKDLKGISVRTMTAFSAISDALIAWPAIQSLLGANTALKDGEPVAQRTMFSDLLQQQGGVAVVILVGAITSVTAIVQFIYVFKEAYEERIDLKSLPHLQRKIIHVLCYAGHIARGIILGIMGFFMLTAGFTKEARHVVNTDKAFDFLGDEVGHWAFAIVATGTICYGLFMLAMGYYYDFRKGK